MKKILKLLSFTFAVCCSALVIVIILDSVFTGTQYSTYGAVTYFDDAGRYQLINSVAEDYVIYDAKEDKFISGFVLYYISTKEKIYMITNPNRTEIVYAILDTKNEKFTTYQDITHFNKNEQEILSNTDNMVNLTIKRSQELKNILKFFPQKWRKW